MYSNSNNRIITKYSDYVLDQAEQSLEPLKRVMSTDSHDHDSHAPPRPQSSDSRSSSPGPPSPEVRVSAEVHTPVEWPLTQPDLSPFLHSTKLKFSEIFSPAQSHALTQRGLLLRSEAGRFLLEAANAKSRSDSDLLLQNQRGGSEENPSRPLQPQKYSAVSLAADMSSVALRRELLSNIRAISRATFFEDLYAGGRKDAQLVQTKSSTTEATINEKSDLEAFLRSSRPETVVSERGELLVFERRSPDSATKRESIDLWVKSSTENLNGGFVEPELNNNEYPPQRGPDLTTLNDLVTSPDLKRQLHESQPALQLYDPEPDPQLQQYDPEPDPPLQLHDPEPDPPLQQYDPEPETAPQQHGPEPEPALQQYDLEPETEPVPQQYDPEPANQQYDLDPEPELQFYEADPEPEAAHAVIGLHSAEDSGDLEVPEVGPEFISKTDTSDSGAFEPIFSQVDPLRPRMPYPLIPPVLNKVFSKQVRYPSVLPRRSPILYDSRRSRRVGRLPGILQRQNMDTWQAKIVWLYINGDEHFPRFEYRYRPGRDVRSWDGLCDILSARLKLTRGVRFIFTLDGYPVTSLEDLRHEHSYVVSSVKKFKALHYGGSVEDEPDDPRRRTPSAPSDRKPPIIRIRRERSLNGVVWGSPQQELSSGAEGGTNKGGRGSRAEAERVVQEVIGQTHPVQKQVVRIINGSDPTVQSQVLLNTRVSQEWGELVKDLGSAVKIPKRHECRMETLTGRQIQSYSQLRSELKAGNQAFYIYTMPSKGGSLLKASGGVPLHFSSLNKLNKCSVSQPALGRSRRRAGNSSTNLLQVGRDNSFGQQQQPIKSVSSSSVYDPAGTIGMKKGRSLSNNALEAAASQPSLVGVRRRKSTRSRSQASTYLAQRSRSQSPE